MQIAFYISGRSRRLIKFIKQAPTWSKALIGLVISDAQIENDLSDILRENCIPFHIIDYSSLENDCNASQNLILSNKILFLLKSFGIDYCFVLGTHLLCGGLLVAYENRLINFHPSILPMFPGLNAIDQIAAHPSAFLCGNTAHFIDEGTDTGPIILQSVIPLQGFLETRDYDLILDMQIDMMNEILELLRDNRIEIIRGRVHIKDADYYSGQIFPKI